MVVANDGEVGAGDEEALNLDSSGPLRFRFSWRKLWRFTGPAWLMSLAYLDPGNLEGDLQQGAYTGVRLVWVLWWATVMGLILQEMSARIAIVTGRDLAQLVRAHYPRWLNYTIYSMMEVAVIGSDIQEVVGSAIALNLLSNQFIPVWVGCIITGLDTLTFLAVQVLGIRYLEGLICLFIAAMSACFIVNWGHSPPAGDRLLVGWAVPAMQSWAVTQAVGTVGAVIMPHNLYLHSGLVLSRRTKHGSRHALHDAIWYSRIESAGALLIAFVINLAVVSTNASNFYSPHCAALPGGPFACLTPPAFNRSLDPGQQGQGQACSLPGHAEPATGQCGALGLQAEGFALEGVLGPTALYMWAAGLLAAAQASTMSCTYAGQIIMGGCLHLELRPWKRVAVTRVAALGPALLVATATISHQSLFNNINEYLNVLQSVQLPFAMLPVLHFAASPALLGEFRSSNAYLLFTVLLAVLVIAVNAYLIVSFLQDPDFGSVGLTAAAIVYAIVYFGVCLRMVWTDVTGMARCAVGYGRAGSEVDIAPPLAVNDDQASAFMASAFTVPLREAEALSASVTTVSGTDRPLATDRPPPRPPPRTG